MKETGRRTRLVLVRHGHVVEKGKLHGQVDVALSDEGRSKLAEVGRRVAAWGISAFYSSDLQRARESAAIMAAGAEAGPRCDQRFRELDMGRWDGADMAELWERERGELKSWWADLENFRTPGGESLADLRSRVVPALGELLARHAGETFCLVAHGGVNRVVLFEALGLSLESFHNMAQDYGCVNLIDYYEGGKPVVSLVNG